MLRADLHILVTKLAEQLQSAAWASVYPSIIDAAERDPEIAALQIGLHEAFMAPFESVVEQARERGEVGTETPVVYVTAAVVGPLFFSPLVFQGDHRRALHRCDHRRCS